jgi:hypothetical protein
LRVRTSDRETSCISHIRRHGLVAGLNDRYVGRVLALVHGRPEESWTIEKLGRQVRLSRARSPSASAR